MNTHKMRRGFVLPTVLLATLLIATLAATIQASVWRASRHARIGFAGERALHGADAAIAAQLAAWDARAFSALPIGGRMSFTPSITASLNTTVTVVRTGLDQAFAEAIATSLNNGITQTATRRVTRALSLRNPPLALRSPLTLLGAGTFAFAGTVSNTDETPPGWNAECQGADSADAQTSSASTASLQTQFDANWHKWMMLASRLDDAATVSSLVPIVTGLQCAPGTGEPHRGGGSVSVCTNEWTSRGFNSSTPTPVPLNILTNSRHQGILMVDGDLILQADLEVYGLLMVRGAIDASAGRLLVHGAALVRDDLGHGSRFGFASRVRYSRCALRRALSATGAPAAVSTRGWLERF